MWLANVTWLLSYSSSSSLTFFLAVCSSYAFLLFFEIPFHTFHTKKYPLQGYFYPLCLSLHKISFYKISDFEWRTSTILDKFLNAFFTPLFNESQQVHYTDFVEDGQIYTQYQNQRESSRVSIQTWTKFVFIYCSARFRNMCYRTNATSHLTLGDQNSPLFQGWAALGRNRS